MGTEKYQKIKKIQNKNSSSQPIWYVFIFRRNNFLICKIFKQIYIEKKKKDKKNHIRWYKNCTIDHANWSDSKVTPHSNAKPTKYISRIFKWNLFDGFYTLASITIDSKYA